MNGDELLDLVSPTDEVIGQEYRSIIYAQKLTNFRVINGFICNSEKKLWIPRRHPSKKLFPLQMDASVGGHVMAGETYLDAFIRETHEELNININDSTYRTLIKLTPHKHATSAFMWVYLINSNSVPKYNTRDFIDYTWLSVDEFFSKLADGHKAKSDLVLILQEIKDLL